MIDWLASNWLALAALVISTGLAFLRLSEWWDTRHRVYVTCRSITASVPEKDGVSTSNRTYVAVTITTEARPVAINEVRFEIVGVAPDPSAGPVMKPVEDLGALAPSGLPPSGIGDPVNLASGASQMWTTALSVPPHDYTTIKGYTFRATVVLTSGKSYKSAPFFHVPSPPGGWSEEDLKTKSFGA